MKGALTLAVALGISGAAFGQSSTHYKTLFSPEAMTVQTVLPSVLTQLAVKPAPLPAPLPERVPDVVVINYGQGGRVYEHKIRFAEYRRTQAKVEVRGPCYSACTMLLTYVKPDNLCIGERAFMAFHAVRSIETAAYMKQETWLYYLDLPRPIRQWMDSHDGSWQSLPLDGYWFLRDRELWALGYPKCN